MSAQARILSILRDGEQTYAQIRGRFPWWWRWTAWSALWRLVDLKMVVADLQDDSTMLYRYGEGCDALASSKTA